MGIRRIRRAVREGRYEFTTHALEEMDDDDLTEADVRLAILNGRIAKELTKDPRGLRFLVRGNSVDSEKEIEVNCRFLPSGTLRIITVYDLEN